MRLLDITATAHAAGNRIDLAWTNPDPATLPGVRVVRREGTHPETPEPETPEDGVVVKDVTGLTVAQDSGLKGETVYYYALFPFRGAPPQFEGDVHNRVAAMATSRYDFAGQIYRLLPEIYRRYDAERTPAPDSGIAAEDREHGQLRRFLDLPGYQLDQLYSLTRAALNLCDLDRVEGQLLPLLAQWIGWQTNYGEPVGAQRTEIRHAPKLYRTIGIIPALEATVARITGWPNRTKEFVHNVARTNQPERLNLWSISRDSSGIWGTPALASLNFVYEGRPASVRLADGSWLFFYHTYRRHGWDIWAKSFTGGTWQPSEPIVDRLGIDKHPTAALQGNRLWLFWENYDPQQSSTDRIWRIAFRTRTGDVWSEVEFFGDPATERRLPAAAADNTDGLWLFWLERTGNEWHVRYNRHDGTQWQLATPATLPLDGGQAPRVEDDLMLFFHPSSANQRLWLFWARHEPGGPAGQTRWTVVYRSKQGLDPNAADWSPIRTLPKRGTGNFHDREPAPLLATGGDIELFWSSTQNGGWSVFRNTLDIDTLAWGTVAQVTTAAHSERAPLAVDTAPGTLLAYRSNESLARASTVYGATRTLDTRYAGTTTVDTGGAGKLALRGTFEDFQTYTYDAGQGGARTDDDRVARDTVGVYLVPDISDPDQIKAIISQLRSVLAEFMPIAGRAVFITP
ncbi:MAG: hypothetical protein ACRDTA_24815 [Pseudonocardiaceae bacterium]